jgi:hypothetical protein
MFEILTLAPAKIDIAALVDVKDPGLTEMVKLLLKFEYSPTRNTI